MRGLTFLYYFSFINKKEHIISNTLDISIHISNITINPVHQPSMGDSKKPAIQAR